MLKSGIYRLTVETVIDSLDEETIQALLHLREHPNEKRITSSMYGPTIITFFTENLKGLTQMMSRSKEPFTGTEAVRAINGLNKDRINTIINASASGLTKKFILNILVPEARRSEEVEKVMRSSIEIRPKSP